MINFWPTPKLDDYLNLQNRVEARMALVDVTATGDGRPVAGRRASDGGDAEAKQRENAQMELGFRDAQLRRLRDEVLDLDDLDDGVCLSDFSLDDFLAQLMNYLQQNREELEATPLGVYAITDCARQLSIHTAGAAAPGVIFCLRQKNWRKDTQIHNPLKAYYLIYVRDDGEVRYNYMHAKQTLELFAELAREQSKPLLNLCDAFDRETDNGRNMKKYDDLLSEAFSAINKRFNRQKIGNLRRRDGVLPTKSEQPREVSDFELITWLVIKDGKSAMKTAGKQDVGGGSI